MVLARVSAVVAVIASVLIVIGSIGPWATVVDSTVGGLEGDGWITLVLAVLAGGFAAAVFTPASVARIMRWLVLPWTLIALLVAVIDIVDISSTSSEFSNQFSDDIFTLSVGWGLWLVLAGSILAVIAAVALMIAPMPAPPRPAPYVPGPYMPGGFAPQAWQQPYPPQVQPPAAPAPPAWPTQGPAYPGSTEPAKAPGDAAGPPPPPPPG